ncbi:MAG: hypothetical protein LKJ21_06285 [Oscillospiraceae bacterium]|jgi:hypothetical protein|nr:hypothetical protein [Oscillospiraceae bacterium]MCI2035740.1 hypothetical protein [Oscillospiraceae bacterium]
MAIETRYGTLHGCYGEEYYDDGVLKNCSFGSKNRLKTACGVLVPRYGPETARNKYGKAVGFYPNGQLRRVALETITGVQTPIGEFPAELLTFYEDGTVCRIFPLNGKITGFWTEKDEEKLAVPLHFHFGFGEFSAKIISVHFYGNGNIQSVTLFPKERVTLHLPFGEVAVRTGFSLYEDGALQTLEPAEPTPVPTLVGTLHAYDSNPIGITADRNSLRFREDGTLARLATVTDKIVVQTPDARLETIAPVQKASPLDDRLTVTRPVIAEFPDGGVRLTCEGTWDYSLSECAFSILSVPYAAPFSDCSGCSGCDGFCGRLK